MKWLSVGAPDFETDSEWLVEVGLSDGSEVTKPQVATDLEILRGRLVEHVNESIVGRVYGAFRKSLAARPPNWIQVSAEASRIGVADCLYSPAGSSTCVVDLALPQAFTSELAIQEQGIDPTGRALIVGDDLEAIAFCAAVSRLGIQSILLAAEVDTAAQGLRDLAAKVLFGSQFEAIPRAQLTQLPADCSVAISLLKSSERELIGDVSYVNFLRSDGAWLDWTGAAAELGFEQDIASAGVRMIDRLGLRKRRNALVLERAGLDARMI